MYDVHHITHQALLLCLPDKFYSYLFIILKMGGWGVWGGMESGRDGGYCLPLFTVILHVFYVEKVYHREWYTCIYILGELL